MVNLGFIRNSEHCPSEVRQIRVVRAVDPLPSPGEATVRIWQDGRGTTRWGLDWSVRDACDLQAWAPLLSAKLVSLNWTVWWLDVTCLARALELPVDKALETWGTFFWPVYSHEALVFLDVGSRRRVVYQVVRRWEKQFAAVRFSSRHDLDGQLPGT